MAESDALFLTPTLTIQLKPKTGAMHLQWWRLVLKPRTEASVFANATSWMYEVVGLAVVSSGCLLECFVDDADMFLLLWRHGVPEHFESLYKLFLRCLLSYTTVNVHYG